MLIATRTFRAEYGGEAVEIAEGERLTDDHELVKRYPDAFASEANHRRLVALRDASRDPRRHESGDGAFRTPRTTRQDGPNAEARDLGVRAIDQYSRSGELRPEAADRLDALVRRRDPLGLGARYLDAVGNPAYMSAFGKVVSDPAHGHLRFTPEEVEAVQRVTHAEATRAMAEGVGSTGGFAVPFTLDPSIMLTSNGALNPMRELARVIQISTREWKGVTSAGVTAEYAAEATEVADASPTLGQPTIVAHRGDAFIPFSIELQQDWSGLQSELLRLITDGRDVLDAQKHLTGTGTNEPQGVLTGLTTTQRVQTTSAGTYAIGDTYKLKQAIPSRFSTRSAWVVSPAIADTTYRFVGGNSTEPALMNEGRDGMLARPVREWSTMTTTTTTGSKIAIYGDFQAGYAIVDRLGATAEIVSHLVGANRRPTGERGLVVWFRSGAGVTVPQALRYLEVL